VYNPAPNRRLDVKLFKEKLEQEQRDKDELARFSEKVTKNK